MLKLKKLTDNSLVVCDGIIHKYSRPVFQGLSEGSCMCHMLSQEQASRWQEVNFASPRV